MAGEQSAVESRHRLLVMQDEFALHRFSADDHIPAAVLSLPFTFIIRSKDELSILAPQSLELDSNRLESGWCGIQVAGPLQFDEIGVLAGLTAVLAEQGIAILAMSSFDTDFLFIKSEHLDNGIAALGRAGYTLQKTR